MKSQTRARWLLEGKGCDNCAISISCKKNQAELLVCGSWVKIFDNSIIGNIMFPIIRNSFPSMVREQPMEAPKDSVYYLEPKWETYLDEEDD